MPVAYSPDFRRAVGAHVEPGFSCSHTARVFGTSRSFVINLMREHGVKASSSGLSDRLRRAGYTYKKSLLANEATRGKHKAKRLHWITKRQPFMANHLHRLVFIDETSVNTKLYRMRGRGLKGHRIHDRIRQGGYARDRTTLARAA